MTNDAILALNMLLDSKFDEDTFHSILSLLSDVKLLLPFNENRLVELEADKKIYIPLFTEDKQVCDDFTYTRLDKVNLNVVLRDIFSLGKYHAISINPYTHDFILNKKMIKIIEKYYI